MTTLGIDLGTGSVKAAVVAADATVRAQARQSYAVTSPAPGWAESDPGEWLAATRLVVERALAAGRERPLAVGFSGQMHGVVVTDRHLVPLRPAVLWADGRSTAQVAALTAKLSAEELSRLGSPAVTGFAATTIAWLLAHEPDVMQRAAHVLQPKDWLRAALGGGIATDPSDASGTLLYDVIDGSWSGRMLEWVGDADLPVPPVLASTQVVGAVRLGDADVPCVVGAADTACALTGLGVGDGDGFLAVGSGAQVVRAMGTPSPDRSLRTHTFASAGAPGDGWYRLGAVQSAGLALTPALAWFGATTEEAAAALAGGIRPDDPVFVPYLSGERTPFMSPRLRGSWHRLGLGTDRPAMLRSILEGVAQAVALGVEAVQESDAAMPDVVSLVGGGTHDAAFRQLLADATGLRLGVTAAADAAVVGAAVLAAGQARNPRRAGHESIVAPDEAAARLLAERRGMMVRLMRSREDT